MTFSPTLAQSPNPSLQTGLFPERSNYDRGEVVEVKMILYNPTSGPIVAHFRSGCWYSFSVLSLSGEVEHNETWPTCDPDINGYENTTNVMTLEPGGGRWTGFSWNQQNLLGFPIATPATYILSLKFTNPDIQIPDATAQVSINAQAPSQLESISRTAFQAFQEGSGLLSVIVVPIFAIRNPLSAPQFKRISWARRLKLGLPSIIVLSGSLVYVIGVLSPHSSIAKAHSAAGR